MTLQYPRRQQQLESLIQRLGLPENAPIQWQLLDLALTHSTLSAEDNYEQLEFVGDAVVKLASAEFLLETYPDLKVGDFTAMRSVLVSDRILALIADQYGFDRYLLVSPGAMADTAGRESRLADSLEAVLAALYLSTHTLQLVRPWLDPHFQQLSTEILADPARQNYKAALQNWTQGYQKTLPEYRTQEAGQTHNDPHRFTAEVWIQGQCLGRGTGRSRKAAEQAAAQEAFLALSRD
ncbi:MAG: ribonuclease III [Leptolyngbyaceae cyanobacterium CSU_1_3]|nr:ribonuclease III [Leptolyngbyaceae cyanobacterium CSU_1_3]